MVKLNILDQVPISTGMTSEEALQASMNTALQAEALGYHRYWFAEHHNSNHFACSSPEIMVARIASITSRMRIGSGGVMLNNYSPFKVAETFRLLEALFPGRIDLGVGRASGGDQVSSMALQLNHQYLGQDHYLQKVQDLAGFLGRGLEEEHPFKNLKPCPRIEHQPEMWLLGSGQHSAQMAASLGIGFNTALFLNMAGADKAMDSYKGNYQASGLYPAPRAAISVFAVVADTEEEAKKLGSSRALLRARSGQPGFHDQLPSVEEALAFEKAIRREGILSENTEQHICGTPEQVKKAIDELVATYSADEVFVLTFTHDPAARIRSYQLLADVYGLKGRDAGSFKCLHTT